MKKLDQIAEIEGVEISMHIFRHGTLPTEAIINRIDGNIDGLSFGGQQTNPLVIFRLNDSRNDAAFVGRDHGRFISFGNLRARQHDRFEQILPIFFDSDATERRTCTAPHRFNLVAP